MKEKGNLNKILDPKELLPLLHDKTHFKSAFQQMVSNEQDMQGYYCRKVTTERMRLSL